MTKKKPTKDKPDVELAILPSILERAVKAVSRFTPNETEGVSIEFYKAGILFKSIDKKNTSFLAVTISKKALNGYKVLSYPLEMTLDADHVKKILTFTKDMKDTIPLLFTLKKERVTLKYSKLTKWFQVPYNIDISQKNAQILTTSTKSFSKLEKLGDIESEPFAFIMKRIGSMEAADYSPDYTTLLKDSKQIELSRKLDHNDDVSAILPEKDDKPINRFTGEFAAHFKTDHLKAGIKAIAPLSESMTIFGLTDHPMIITGHGTDPEEATTFKEEIDFWYALAPTIVED